MLIAFSMNFQKLTSLDFLAIPVFLQKIVQRQHCPAGWHLFVRKRNIVQWVNSKPCTDRLRTAESVRDMSNLSLIDVTGRFYRTVPGFGVALTVVFMSDNFFGSIQPLRQRLLPTIQLIKNQTRPSFASIFSQKWTFLIVWKSLGVLSYC
jgi:hypothetical protein